MAALQVPRGPKTIATLRSNVSVGVQYLEAWLGGMGCVPLENLMEDAATAEICRTQVTMHRSDSPQYSIQLQSFEGINFLICLTIQSTRRCQI